jgi:hypothetical protein
VLLQWVGRVFVQNGNCGASGENCSMGEFNMDTGDFYTPQAYDISNIQGYTQAMSITGAGCETVSCSRYKYFIPPHHQLKLIHVSSR